MNNTNFVSKKLKGRGFSSAPLMNKHKQKGRTLLPICEADAPLFLSAVCNKKYTSEKITSSCPQSGRSMIEMLGVLAIIGVLSVGGIAGYSKAMMKYKINKTIEQITLTAGNVRTFFSTQKNYKDLNPDATGAGNWGDYLKFMQKARLVPDEMWIDGEIYSVFASLFELYPVSKSIEYDYKAFAISIAVPEEACIDLASQDWTATNIKAINFCDSNGPDTCLTLKTPIEISDAASICSLTSGDDSAYGKGNTMMSFYFDVDVNSAYWQAKLN